MRSTPSARRITGRWLASLSDPEGPDLRPGDYVLARNTPASSRPGVLYYVCPCGCGSVGTVPLREAPLTRHESKTIVYGEMYGKAESREEWHYFGPPKTASVYPSIRSESCGWHGYLKDGVWEIR